MNKVAVVILNYNGKTFLERFLPTVIQHSASVAEIVVADNASTDDSVAFMKANFPEVRLIQLSFNGGFSTGYNEALKQIEAEYYVLLNSDIEVTPRWIEPIVALLDSDQKIVACQPKIRSYTEKEKFEYAGAGGGFIDKYGYPFCRGRLFETLEQDENQFDDTIEVFWASGACMFVRSELFHQYGGLDDSFFAHMEEIDFCWRLKSQGYKVMYCPQSMIYHIGGGTLSKNSPRKTYLNFRNNLSLLLKNLPRKRLFFVLPYRILLDMIAGMKFLLDGSFRDAFAIVRAHFAFYRRIPLLLKKRKNYKPQEVSGVYQKNIVFDYFLKKKKYFKDLNLTDFS
ncbi:MAG: glycosyltransferase family 2 protein [Lentimicrobiaceae bacterium]|nr:glycosyltransferase family 2 protein [Lentimicrobiaceae bacterium]